MTEESRSVVVPEDILKRASELLLACEDAVRMGCKADDLERFPYLPELKEVAEMLSAAPERAVEVVTLAEACKPWEFCAGDPPEWESPLMDVWQAAVMWCQELVAVAYNIEHYDSDGGSESLDGDALVGFASIVTQVVDRELAAARSELAALGDLFDKKDLFTVFSLDSGKTWKPYPLRERVELAISSALDNSDAKRADSLFDELAAERAKVVELTRQRDRWEADARMAQANWNAACHDISKLEAQLRGKT